MKCNFSFIIWFNKLYLVGSNLTFMSFSRFNSKIVLILIWSIIQYRTLDGELVLI